MSVTNHTRLESVCSSGIYDEGLKLETAILREPLGRVFCFPSRWMTWQSIFHQMTTRLVILFNECDRLYEIRIGLQQRNPRHKKTRNGTVTCTLKNGFLKSTQPSFFVIFSFIQRGRYTDIVIRSRNYFNRLCYNFSFVKKKDSFTASLPNSKEWYW